VRWFQPENAPKGFGGRAPLGPAGGAYSAPPSPLAGFKGQRHGQGKRKGPERDSSWEDRGGGVTKEWQEGWEGKMEGRGSGGRGEEKGREGEGKSRPARSI